MQKCASIETILCLLKATSHLVELYTNPQILSQMFLVHSLCVCNTKECTTKGLSLLIIECKTSTLVLDLLCVHKSYCTLTDFK